MKLTVFGASGGIGGHLVQQALDAGHTVTAVVRDTSKIALRHPALKIVTVPGLTDPAPLQPALQGADAVLSGVGPRGRKDGPVASHATHGILQAMATAGIRRLVVVSASPVGPIPDGDGFLSRRILTPFISSILRDTYVDLGAMEDEIRASATDWTVVRPPKLSDRPLSAAYRTAIGANVPNGFSIGRADVAHAMLGALTNPATIRQPVGVAN